jgi:perosamine synthetase
MDAGKLDFESGKVGAAIFIDHNGSQAGLEAVIEACDKWCVPVIEDACQGLGCDGAGTLGRLACFSFSPQKLLTTGQGGIVVTNDDHLASRVRQLLDHGGDWRKERVFHRAGGNFRFNDVLASLGLAQLAMFDSLKRARDSVRLQYHQFLGQISDEPGWCALFPSRDPLGLIGHLNARGIESARLYPPVHWSPLHTDGQDYPGACAVYGRDVYLPSYGGMVSGDIQFICQAIQEFEQ